MSDGREVANYILEYADESGISVTTLGLQKITHFYHVWFLISAKLAHIILSS